MSATLASTEDQIFDAVWQWCASLFDVDQASRVVKGFQNFVTSNLESYVVISPSIKERKNQIRREYDAALGVVNVERDTVYSYQIDAYGSKAPDLADIITIAWPSLWTCDALAQIVGQHATPLYADEPMQLNFANAENQYEQRFTCKLYLQANQIVTLPQDFFDTLTPVIVIAADNLPSDV